MLHPLQYSNRNTLHLLLVESVAFQEQEGFPKCPFLSHCSFKDALNHSVEFYYLGNSKQTLLSQPKTVLIRWIPPDEGWFKINTDGACDPSSHLIVAGGLIRDCSGNWIKGFQQFLDSGDSFLAELWGACLGCKLALSSSASKVCLELDCLDLVKILNDTSLNSLHHQGPLIDSCRFYLSHFDSFKVLHVMREGNQCADALASYALSSKCNFISLDLCPAPFVCCKLFADILGIQTPSGNGQQASLFMFSVGLYSDFLI